MIVVILVTLSMTQLWSQEAGNFRIPLIGDSVPSFTAESTTGTIHFPNDYGRKWKILLSHPQDWTPVCSTEILELAYMQSEFDKLNAKIVIVSTDPLETHKLWVKALEEIRYKDRDPVMIRFPLVEDQNRIIARMYGMIHSSTSTTKDVRGVFIIDPDNILQAVSFYPMQTGRNIDEIKRSVIALQAAKVGISATPANWQPGDDMLIPYRPEATSEKQNMHGEQYYDPAWFIHFKKSE